MAYSFSVIFQQLAVQSPILLAYGVGLILALIFIRRAPRPAILAAVAFATLFFTTIGVSVAWVALLQLRTSSGWSLEHFGLLNAISSIIANFIHAACIGLLIAAIFTGRTTRQPMAFPVVVPNSH